MPELPEVEVLVRHLAPLLRGRRIRGVEVGWAKSVRPHVPADFAAQLHDAVIEDVTRRAKFLVFRLRRARAREPFTLLGHLGMTGRMWLQPRDAALPKHAVVALGLGAHRWVFEDTRRFGRLSLDASPLAALGPEPWDGAFTPEALRAALRRRRQAIKVRLLDQSLVAGLGNIYASEVLHRARISPRRHAGGLKPAEAVRLHGAIRGVLEEAIGFGSTVPLDFGGVAGREGLFYYGRAEGVPDGDAERLAVYDRAGQPCGRCGRPIRRIVQAGRSTYFCTGCQR
ncbi:MAG: bifunctional DNA-formamidopyrimidine glycosylase/DNA-(apurinic or apyrimidinic site) lyase [Limisphaerales bacterium]